MEHYKELNTVQANNIDNISSDEKTNLEQVRNFSPLDFSVTDVEVSEAIKYLKNGKAAGPDLIRNEMIKYGNIILTKPITKFFNLVMNPVYYPDNWFIGRIVFINKKGDINNPANYRGITISIALVKKLNLFSIIDYVTILKLRPFYVRAEWI